MYYWKKYSLLLDLSSHILQAPLDKESLQISYDSQSKGWCHQQVYLRGENMTIGRTR